MSIKQVPDVTRGSHFGCGALLGLVVGFIGFGKFLHRPTLESLEAGLVWALAVGVAAALLGNFFWRHAHHLVWWWLWPAVVAIGVLVLVLWFRSCEPAF